MATAAVLYARHLDDVSTARACDGFDYVFVHENHNMGMNLKNGESFSPVIDPVELRGCVRIDSVTAGADGSASVVGQIRLQSVTYGEREFPPDIGPYRPLLFFVATYGYPHEGKMRWEFWEPDGTPSSNFMHLVLRDLCAPFAEAASPGVYRSRYETIETESGGQHVRWKAGESPHESVVGWYTKPGGENPVEIYAEYYRERQYVPRPTRSLRLRAVAIDPTAASAPEPSFDQPIGE